MDQNLLHKLLELEKQKVIDLQQQLDEVNQELHKTNHELLSLTLDLDETVERRTRELQLSEQELREHRDFLHEMVQARTESLRHANRELIEKNKELEASEDRFRSLITAIPDIVFRLDSNGNFTLINESINRLGYTPEELVGQHFTKIIDARYHDLIVRDKVLNNPKQPKGLDVIPKLFDERRTGERKTQGLEVELLAKRSPEGISESNSKPDRTAVVVEVNSAGLYDHKNWHYRRERIGSVGIMRDITERKTLEENLKTAKNELEKKVQQRTVALLNKNEELEKEIERRRKAEEVIENARKDWQEIFHAIGQMAMVLDKERRIITANSAFLERMGKSLKEIEGLSCCEVMHNSDVPLNNCPVSCILNEKKKETEGHEVEIKGKNYLVSCTPVYGKDGELKSIIHIATDITQTKTLERELLQAQKMEAIGTIAGGIAHDFNNILSIILGYTSLSEQLVKDQPQLVENFREITLAGERARDLVRQILTFARRSDEKVLPIKVKIIAKEIVKLLRSVIPSSIAIDDSIVSEGYVSANPTQLHQIFMNLATNAAHAMEAEGGTLELHVTDCDSNKEIQKEFVSLAEGHYVKIEVSDTGVGIPADKLDVIFEPYFTTKEQGKGTGLGLSVVHGIVKSCGGKIYVKSTHGSGTCFTIFLPKATGEIKEEPDAQDVLPRGNERVLVLDDEMIVAKMTARMLGSFGYTTTFVTDSQEAFDLLYHKPGEYDLLISDVTMPKLTGDVLAEKVLAQQPDLPIILCTGYNSRISKEKAATIGVKALLMKPLSSHVLAHSVRSVLDGAKTSLQQTAQLDTLVKT